MADKISIVESGEPQVTTNENYVSVGTDNPSTKDTISVVDTPTVDDSGNVVSNDEELQALRDQVDGTSETQDEVIPQDQVDEQIDPQADMDALAQSRKDTSERLHADGIDFDALRQEYLSGDSKGLTDETVAALEAKGYSKAEQDTIIAGQEAQISKVESQLHSLAGGDEKAYVELFTWANDTVTEAERTQILETYASNDFTAISMMVSGLKARMDSTKVPTPVVQKPIIQGNPRQASTGVQGFSSRAEADEAFRDPQYKTSVTFRKNVEAKMMKSRF